MKKVKGTLTLKKETIRTLTPDMLRRVAGGDGGGAGGDALPESIATRCGTQCDGSRWCAE